MEPDETELKAELSRRFEEAEADAASALIAESRTPEQLPKIAENAAGFADAMRTKHLHPASPPVACKDGCDWCCYQLVPVSVPEVLRIVAYLREHMSDAESSSVAQRLRALDKATRGLTSEQRVRIPKPCAYLHNHRCTIYPVRPLACVEFTSYDVQVCKRGKRIGFKPGSVTHETAGMIAYISVQRGLATGLKRGLPEVDTESLELTAASVVAIDTPDAAAGWINGSKVFASAHLRRAKK
jgi:Fe-S-cluster containining protein